MYYKNRKYKICSHCNKRKELKYFFKRNDRLGGYSSKCKDCKKESIKKWYRTKGGLIKVIYNNQIKSSIKRGHDKPSYSFEELKEWIVSRNNFNKLFSDWGGI